MRHVQPVQHIGLNIAAVDRHRRRRRLVGTRQHAGVADDVDHREAGVGRVDLDRQPDGAAVSDVVVPDELEELRRVVFDRQAGPMPHEAEDVVELIADDHREVQHIGVEVTVELGDDLQRHDGRRWRRVPAWRGQEAREMHVVQRAQGLLDRACLGLQAGQQLGHTARVFQFEPQVQPGTDLARGHVVALGRCQTDVGHVVSSIEVPGPIAFVG